MINEEIVYKILIKGLHKNYPDGWVTKVNVIPYTGGSGKTWTSKKLVKKNLAAIKTLRGYGVGFDAEIKVFRLTPLEVDIRSSCVIIAT